ncbi:MAG: hypothetical protein JXL97_10800 [Bacteroidales bacterium]|nr:hypothetical protein [Bacteroidales bacterium]
MKQFLLLFFTLVIMTFYGFSQNEGTVRGNFQTTLQTYTEDTLIGAQNTPEKLLLNSYANILYSNNNFSAGLRYEGYFNTLQGYDSKNDGFGFPYRFVQYNTDNFDITVGNFYEQFGSGLVFRSFEDKYIGYDNAMDGLRVKFSPVQGVYLTSVIGRQRYSFLKNDDGISQVSYSGLVRGINLEFSPNDVFKVLEDKKTRVLLGYSFVSKYQKEQNQYLTLNDTTYLLDIPENVTSMSGRLNINRYPFAFSTEYAYKFNDPLAENGYIYKPGNALFMNLSFSKKGFGIILTAKRIDNFSFRSDRTATLSDLNINYIPDLTRNHIYAFSAFYPYASQNNGEMGLATEINYKIKKESFLGGKYGTGIRFNYSIMNSIQHKQIADDIPLFQKGTDGYTSDFFALGDELYYQDITVEINKKVSKKFKFNFLYQNLTFDFATLRGEPEMKTVYANIFVLDFTISLKKKHALRIELEELLSEQDMGSWAMASAEYTISPHWFFSATDQYNYENPKPEYQAHYYNFAFGYKINATRVQFSYGRQRAGVVCIGGVCRSMPATNGFMFTLTSSF